jgi:hypothetical protein
VAADWLGAIGPRGRVEARSGRERIWSSSGSVRWTSTCWNAADVDDAEELRHARSASAAIGSRVDRLGGHARTARPNLGVSTATPRRVGLTGTAKGAVDDEAGVLGEQRVPWTEADSEEHVERRAADEGRLVARHAVAVAEDDRRAARSDREAGSSSASVKWSPAQRKTRASVRLLASLSGARKYDARSSSVPSPSRSMTFTASATADGLATVSR